MGVARPGRGVGVDAGRKRDGGRMDGSGDDCEREARQRKTHVR